MAMIPPAPIPLPHPLDLNLNLPQLLPSALLPSPPHLLTPFRPAGNLYVLLPLPPLIDLRPLFPPPHAKSLPLRQHPPRPPALPPPLGFKGSVRPLLTLTDKQESYGDPSDLMAWMSLSSKGPVPTSSAAPSAAPKPEGLHVGCRVRLQGL